jgi:hypothetical protein
MAEPTLKDVLKAIAEIRGDVAKLDSKIDKVDAKVDAHRAETKAGFAALDEELSLHAKVHRKIEHDITALKGRPPRTAARPARRPRAR